MTTTARHGRRLARRAAVLLALLAALAAGCGGEGAPDGAAQEQKAQLMRAGARVFAEHCQTCHPLLGRANTRVHTDYPPGLDLDQVSPAPAYAKRIVSAGHVAMGSFDSTLSAEQQRAVVAYVLEVGGRDVLVPEGVSEVQVERGRRLYDEHCQACHKLEGRPATEPNPIWVATDFDELRPSVIHTERLMREGQFEAMPSFRDRLDLFQMRAIALYVNRAARGGPPDSP